MVIDPSYASYVQFCGRLGQSAQEYEQWAWTQHKLSTIESDPQMEPEPDVEDED